MSCIKKVAIAEPLIDGCEKGAVNSSICKIFEVDLYTCKIEDLDFSSAYELTFFRNDTVHALISWFDIYFDRLPNKVEFTTSPFSKQTHWKQVIFYLEQDINVEKSEILKGSIAVRKSKVNFRELDVKISYHLMGYNGEYDYNQLYKIH